jgi:hypothetical protein
MSFSIRPEDIDVIEDAGVLENQPVKMIRTKGGYHMAVHKGKVISGGSHPAIVKHAIGKMFPNFQAVMCKSEMFSDALVDKHSHFLSDDLRKSGHDIYSIQNLNDIEFQITKHNIKVASINTHLQSDGLYIPEIKVSKEFIKPLAAATTEKALACNAKTIKVK